MFNIESWLRQHGRRLLKRFDPYTYILFSRAMDLHDVSEGRGNLVSALENVRCKTVVVGASSDYLYGPEEVHLGADILRHLGKEVQYRELRSPHGHDAVFIEMDQIDSILKDALEWTVRPARLPAARDLKHVRLGILGAGKVAASFIRLLQQQKERLARDFGLEFHVAGVSELDADKQLDPAFKNMRMDFDPPKFVESADFQVLIELTRGECAKPLVEAALTKGRPVVTPNKPLIRNHGPEMERLGLAHGVRIAWHNSLVEGWPLLFSVERPLAQERIESIHAVLSGTCNIVLEEYEQGGSLESGLEKASAAGFTEQDPELDLSGWDTAQKLAILISRASGQLVAVEDMHVEGIHDLDPELVKLAPKIGLRVKLVALYDRRGDAESAVVMPMAVPEESHLGTLKGGNNAVILSSPSMGETVQLGTGTGSMPVASAVLNDLIGLYHPSRSWTARLKRTEQGPAAPRFTRWLALDEGRLVLVKDKQEGGVPLFDSLASD